MHLPGLAPEPAPNDTSDGIDDAEYAAWVEAVMASAETHGNPTATGTAHDEPFDGDPNEVVSPLPSRDELLAGLNDQQAAAVAAGDGPLLVVAGPGSGKTRVLTHRIARLLADGVKPWEIFAVTFTNKAAAEMRERLERLVGHSAVSSMWVSTFHSACARILRREHAAAGLKSGFTIIDADDAAKVVLRIVFDELCAQNVELRSLRTTKTARPLHDHERARETELTKELRSEAKEEARTLRDEISRAKGAMKTPAEVAHEPGAAWFARVWDQYEHRLALMNAVDFDDLLSKTLTLLRTNTEVRTKYQQRFRHVLVDEFQDSNVVQLELAKILAAHWGNLCGVGDLDQCHPAGTFVTTIAGVAAIEELTDGTQILTGHASAPAGTVTSTATRDFSGVLVELHAAGRTTAVTPGHRIVCDIRPAAAAGSALVVSHTAGNWHIEVVPAGDVIDDSGRPATQPATQLWVLHFGAAAELEMRRSAIISAAGTPDSWSDTTAAVVLASAGATPSWPWADMSVPGDEPGWARIAASCVRDGMLVKTTSGAGFDTAAVKVTHRAYTGNVTSLNVEPTHTYIADGIVVGNCIYGWRGAHPDGMANFTREFPDATVIVLDQNYRSTAAILETCQAIIEQNAAPHRASLWTENDPGVPVEAHEAADDRAEARWVADRISRMHRPYDDHAVLVRVNAQTRAFEEAFSAARIPYRLVGTTKFYDRAEVRDALAWLRVTVNPLDVLSFERAAGAPKRGVGDRSVAAVLDHASANAISTAEATRQLAGVKGRGQAALRSFADALDAVAGAASNGPADALRAVLDAAGLRAHWERQPEGFARIENLEELVSAASEFMETGLTADGEVVADLDGFDQVAAFVEHAALVSSADETGEAQVQLMTIHAAKGREFPVVHVVGLEERLLPHSRGIDSPTELAEERRLLFVACSRAMERLALSWARQRMIFGDIVSHQRSRFVDDLPETVEMTKEDDARPRPTPGGTRTAGSWPQRQTYQRPNSTHPQRRQPAPRHHTPTVAARPARAARPAQPQGPRLDASAVSAGDRVRHTHFGSGKIVSVTGTTLSVRFDDGRTRTLDSTLAPLTSE